MASQAYLLFLAYQAFLLFPALSHSTEFWQTVDYGSRFQSFCRNIAYPEDYDIES